MTVKAPTNDVVGTIEKATESTRATLDLVNAIRNGAEPGNPLKVATEKSAAITLAIEQALTQRGYLSCQIGG